MSQDESRGFLCAHCRERHITIDQARECASTRPIDDSPPIRVTGRVGLEPDWARLAGPDAIARGLLIRSESAIPDPWSGAERVSLSSASPTSAEHMAGTLSRLHTARTNRQRVVVQLDGTLPAAAAALDLPLAQLSPEVELPNEALIHLILSNAVDARDLSSPSIHAIDLAVAAGARPATGDETGDVVASDGTPLWCDGGRLQTIPIDRTEGVGVVPLVHLVAGILGPTACVSVSSDLAPDQVEAVASLNGGARIVAPAGSGKTRVLTERARHLVLDLGVQPSVVCLVAFNVRARAEMQERTTDLDNLEVRTLNSLALAICRGTGPFRSRQGSSLHVIDERAVRSHLRELVQPPRRAMTDPFAAWIEAFGACRLGLRDPHDVEQDFDGDVPGLAGVLAAYRNRLAQKDELDFDEQIIGAIQVLLTDPAARATARKACGLLLIDEFQDLTPAHLLMLRLLAGPASDVFGVGDDDQTIYGYAGASPSWLIEFTKWFPGSGCHDLHVNYRCAPEVVEAASNLLTHNRRRIPKQIRPAPGRADAGPGEISPLHRVVASDPVDSLAGIVDDMLDDGTQPEHIVVLSRVNATLLAPMLKLRSAGLVTTTPIDGTYLNRTGVAAALAWLDLATSADGRLRPENLTVAARRPPRGISPRVVEWIAEQSSIEQIRRLASRLRTERDQLKIEGVADDIGTMRGLAAEGADSAQILAAVRDQIGLGGALETKLDASRRSLDRSSHGDDLDALISVAHLQPDPTEFPSWLGRQLEGARNFDDSDGIRLSTIHRVKGMEWPRVVVYGVDEGLFPHRLSSDVEEERRILHVAITRSSRQTVIISSPRVSSFLDELDKPAPPAPPEPFHPTPPTRPSMAARKTSRRKAAAVAVVLSEADSGLRDRLREWRSKTARARGVPAYVVLDNRTIDAIAAARPADTVALLAISGIGPTKLETYGESILALVAEN